MRELASDAIALTAPKASTIWGARLLFVSAMLMALGLCTSLVLMHVGLGLGVVGLGMTRAPIHRLPGFWWAVAFAVWQLMSMGAGAWEHGTSMWERRYGAVYVWLSLFVAIEAFRIPGARLLAVILASIAAGVSLVLSAAQFFLGYGGKAPLRVSGKGMSWTSSGFFSKHLTQGFQMSMIALLAWTQVMSTTSRSVRGIQWLGRFAPVLCILLTGGRSGLIGLLSAWFAWFGSSSRRRFLMAMGVVMVTGALAVGWLAFVRPQAVTDAVALKDGRIIHWQVASVLIKENPIFGIGGSEEWQNSENARVVTQLYPDGSQDQWKRAPDAHNSFLGLAAEHGIPAVMLYLGILGSVLLHLWWNREATPWAWRLGCGAVACALAAGQFEHYAGRSVSSYGIYITLGFAVAMTLPERSNPWRCAGGPTTPKAFS
jgi:O-antigen ligase